MATQLFLGTITHEDNTQTNVTKFEPLSWVLQRKSYVNGGVTFTYPAGHFLSPPIIRISIQPTGLPYVINRIFSPVITSNSTTSTTIRVNSVVLDGILATATEIGTGDVLVHLEGREETGS